MTRLFFLLLINIKLCCLTINAQNINAYVDSLSQKEKDIVGIAAFTANGKMIQLKAALHKGLSDGLTINSIKEVIVQLYAYAGFPRSLNALTAFMEVLKERNKNGLKDETGKEPSPFPTDKTRLEFGTTVQTTLVGSAIQGPVYEFAPVIDQFLKEHLFADIFGRDNLDFKTREIATIAALASIGGVENQLRSHFNVGMYNGLTEKQAKQIVSILKSEVGQPEAASAYSVLETVLQNKVVRAQTKDSMNKKFGVEQLKITVGGKVLFATFTEGKTTEDFKKLLPLTLNMNDIGNREKYSGIATELSKTGTTKTTYTIGDISYWLGGGIAIFYNKDDREIKAGLIVLAHLQTGIEIFKGAGSLEVTFEAVEK